MARPLRIQFPGAVYHVTCRRNERRNIFVDDEDRKKFLHMVSLSLNIYSVKLHAYVLMDNHFHFLVETPLGILVEKESYLAVLSRYIHLNPIRMVRLEKSTLPEKLDELLRYPWSSLPGYL